MRQARPVLGWHIPGSIQLIYLSLGVILGIVLDNVWFAALSALGLGMVFEEMFGPGDKA